MSGDSEYVAMRAAGLTKIHIFRPFILIAIIVAFWVFLLTQELVPNAHRKVRKKIKIISSASLIQGLKSGQFFTNLDNITIFPGKMDENTKKMNDVFLQIYNPKELLEKVIVAKNGEILHNKDEKTGVESFKLFLKDGTIVNLSEKVNNLEKIRFEEYLLPISEKRFSYATSLKEIMMNRKELSEFINGGLKKALKDGFNKKEYFNARYEYWNRINTPILCMLLVFVGFGLGVAGNRGKSKNSSGKGILILISYYLIYFSIVSTARGGQVPIFLCAVLPNLFLIIMGFRYFKKIDWIS